MATKKPKTKRGRNQDKKLVAGRVYNKGEWEYLVGFNGLAFVTIDSKIWYDEYKRKPIKEVPQHINRKYLRVGVERGGLKKTFQVHRAIAIAFIPNPQNKPEVNHKDGNKLNNAIQNLEWATRKENAEHAGKNGLMNPQKGELHSSSKLKDADIVRIRESKFTQAKIAETYNVSRQLIQKIRQRKSWAHVV